MCHLSALLTAGHGKAVQSEADLKGSAEKGGETRAQADAAGPALHAATAMTQTSKSLIPQPAKQFSAEAAVKKKVSIRVATAHAESS